MGVAVADGDQSNQKGASMVDVSSPATSTKVHEADTAPLLDGVGPSLDGAGPLLDGVGPPLDGAGPLLDGIGPPLDDPGASPDDPGPPAFSLEGLVLLGAEGNQPVDIDAMTFADVGIGVARFRGEQARVLPWTSVVTHAVEPWSGGVIPEWWVDPELNRASGTIEPASVTDPDATNRSVPHAEAGALISIQTLSGTYRFLLPGRDARSLSRQVAAFAVKNQGPSGASSVTRVVAWGQDIERRRVKRKPKREVTWPKIQPFLVVALILFIGAAVTLILLQSAGTVHLPYLGGASSGTIGSLRNR